MIAQQRLIGNITGRGHGDPLLSPSFPLDCKLATAVNYRLPDVSTLPSQASYLSDNKKFCILVTTFELQATHFGRAMLISSSIFRTVETNGPVRPTMFMNTVAMSDESGAPLSFVPLETLLLYDDFIKPAQFVTLNASTKALQSAPFSPDASPKHTAFFAPNTAAHRALLIRYWSAASTRFFGGLQQSKETQGCSVCLGTHFQCMSIIEGAKSLLLCDILRYLPPAVRNIASMSAGTSQASTRDIFKDSALVVVFPTASNDPYQPTFDLRTEGCYPQISALENQFIAAVLAGQTSFMDDAVARCMRLKGLSTPSQVSFAADYDFALLLYQLEQSVVHGSSILSPAQCVNVWRQLNILLINRHHFTVAQSNIIFAGIEAQVIAMFAHSEAILSVIDASTLPALWQKALSVSDELFGSFCNVIAACPASSQFPQMVTMYANIGEQGQRRTAQLIQLIATKSYAQRPFDDELITSLTDAAFTSVADRHPGITAALAEGVARNNATFPDNLLVTLPLSCHLPRGKQDFENALELLCSKYTRTLPSQSLLENLRNAYACFGNNEAHTRLCDYFTLCLPAYADALDTLATAVACVLPHTDMVLGCILKQAAQCNLLFTAQQEDSLFSTLLPLCEHPERIGVIYGQTESDLSRSLGETPCARLDRLRVLAKHLHTIAYDATSAVTDMLFAFSQSHQLLTPEQAEAVVSILWPLCADRSRVMQAFQVYLTAIVQDDPFYHLNHIEDLRSLIPFIRSSGIDMTQTLCGILDGCAEINPCVSLDYLNTLIIELQPLCRDNERLANALLSYADASRRDCQRRRIDGFVWLYGLMGIMAENHLLIGDMQADAALMMIDHLSVFYQQTHQTPSEQAYTWLEKLPAQSALFARIQDPMLTLLDALMHDTHNTRALKCFETLRDSLTSTVDYPSLKQSDQNLIFREFTAELASHSFDKALENVYAPMKRCGLSVHALLNKTAGDVENSLRRRFSQFKAPNDFIHARLVASSSDPRALLHNQVLTAVFDERYPAFRKACKSLDQLNRLNGLAQQIGSLSAQSDAMSRQVHTLLSLINQPRICLEAFSGLLDEGLRILQEEQQDSRQLCALLEEAIVRSLPYFSFPQSVLTAMLCSYHPEDNAFDWIHVFLLLGLKAEDKLPTPYSTQGQVWLATIHAICRALDVIPSGRYKYQFIDTLSSGSFAIFTRSVRDDQKHLSYFFPTEVTTSSLLHQWLATERHSS